MRYWSKLNCLRILLAYKKPNVLYQFTRVPMFYGTIDDAASAKDIGHVWIVFHWLTSLIACLRFATPATLIQQQSQRTLKSQTIHLISLFIFGFLNWVDKTQESQTYKRFASLMWRSCFRAFSFSTPHWWTNKIPLLLCSQSCVSTGEDYDGFNFRWRLWKSSIQEAAEKGVGLLSQWSRRWILPAFEHPKFSTVSSICRRHDRNTFALPGCELCRAY